MCVGVFWCFLFDSAPWNVHSQPIYVQSDSRIASNPISHHDMPTCRFTLRYHCVPCIRITVCSSITWEILCTMVLVLPKWPKRWLFVSEWIDYPRAAMDRAGAAENILRPSGALKSGPRSDLPLTLEYGAICSTIPTSDQPVRTVSEQIMVLYILVWLFWISPELTVAWLFECWLHSGWAPPTNFEDSFFFFAALLA